MKSMAFVALALSAAAPLRAQSARGDWVGALDAAPGVTLHLALHIAPALEGGGMVGSLDSLDQGAMGIPIADIRATPGALAFTAPSIGASYSATWNAADKRWDGQFSQGGRAMPLALAAAATPAPKAITAVAGWVVPDDATVAALLDRQIGARDGVVAVAALVDHGKSRTVARGGAAIATRFEIGSITKLFTALLLTEMASKGEVALDDPVAKYLPPETLPERGMRAITLRDLASHYSGLPRLPANLVPAKVDDPYVDYTAPLMVKFLRDWQPNRAPGASFGYSNFGAGLLGYALGRAAHKPYAELLRERVLAPLRMEATDFGNGGVPLAVPHDAAGRIVSPWHFAVLQSAGGLVSTAPDMARFAQALLDPPPNLKHAVALLSDRPRPAGAAGTIGVGLFSLPTTGGKIYFHDGATAGFQSMLVLDQAAQRAAVVLINSAGAPPPAALAIHLVTGNPLPATR